MSIDKNFINLLEEKYKEIRDGEKYWEQEKDKVLEILSEVESNIKSRYKIKSPIKIGGTGIVIKVCDENLNVYQALKCARPVAEKEILLTKIIASEISRLRESSHPNIVSIFYQGVVNKFDKEWPYYIMEYIEGAVDALDYIENYKPNHISITKIIQQCVEGLNYLHHCKILHGDIKLENFLVAPDERAKITDLGSARLLIPEREEYTSITFTRDFAHPKLRSLLVEEYETDPNRARTEMPRSKLEEIFDIYALGKNVLRILKKYDIAEYKLIPLYYRQYLELMACRMLDSYNEDDECALGLPKTSFNEIKYSSAEEVLIDIKKLTGEYSIYKQIPELNPHFPRTIQVSSPAPSSFTKRVANILSSPYLRRFASISQLGLIVQVFPTATHSRLEHILGVYATVARYCDSLWNDPINPLFKQIMSEYHIKLILLAALCHDIGQYPLAHDLEEADAKLFSHRDFSIKLLTNTDNSESILLNKTMKKDWGVDSKDVAELLSTDPTNLDNPLRTRLLHTLINGPIDADKMDYLIRDSNNLNVPYGRCIDFERLLKCLTVVFKPQDIRTYVALGIHEKGKIPAEAVAFARYAMFGSVYWHHSSRSVKSMLHRAVWEAIPKVDRRSREYKEFQLEFLNETLTFSRTIKGKPEQAELFKKKRINALLEAPQLSLNDYLTLLWIYEKTTDAGKRLIEMICKRNIFKRLLVISERKNPSLWDKLADLRKNYYWQEWIIFQNEIQNKLIRIIDTIPEEERTSTILSKNKTDVIVGRSNKGEILFLVDIPGERKGSSVDLHYLTESRIYGPLKSTHDRSVQMEDSIIWTTLSKNFLKSVGKVRVFCNPDIIETCSICLNRSNIESTLEAAYKYVTK